MLFTYKYIKHDIEKLQEFLDFLFYDVWLFADGEFDAEKLNGNPDLKQIYEDFGNVDYDPATAKKGQKGKSEYLFNSSIEKIYAEFAKIDEAYKLELIDLYHYNNHIELLCSDKSKLPISYAQIKAKYPSLEKAINEFYSKLYGPESPFNLDAFGQLTKKLIPDHYEAFMTDNNEEVCPFCGILPIKGNNHSYRDAYDHYLPKGLYPFNSLNFKNLAPMCHECNSTYKLTDDPIYEDYKKIDPLKKEDNRQLAFYPYSENHPELEIKVELTSKDIKNLQPQDINLEIKSEGNEEQIESWKRVFGIEERYKALCCHKNEGLEWFNSVVDGFNNAKEMGVTDFSKWVEFKLKEAGTNKLSNYGFLKAQFLTECRDKGIFNANA
ncbi:hypothetical protein SAMN04488519_106144 [Algoriphagus ornithinivorans]|uniref:HNH endonuclease n=1 Tax=Algoriphagus ornithinivorans TaxID=226506 RepID=A0A1I5GY04_9BACT|nr:hypothetical protein [Algoriphagus ornithinivorans]SFO40835.1 hypothetical protein SAMN04488519_106144 [Algoriphagus ornithinivorans]